MLEVAEGQGPVPGWEVSLSGKELSDEQHRFSARARSKRSVV